MKIDRFWAGTDEALAEYILFVRAHAKEAYGYQPAQQDQPDTGSRLLNKQGSVGVITIAGSLTNGSRGYGNYMTTYNEIRDAMIQAAADPQVKTILLDIKSGGGSVQGLSDTADLIRKVDAKVKPVHSFSDAAMCSAAYWLGSSARKVHASNMADIGSIGVIATHTEYTKMLENDGITPTVIRSGAYKGLGSPYEKLSDRAEATIQGQVDHMAGIFDNYIADRRGMTVDAFKKKAGEGRVFVGQQGVDAGLVDSITTFDALVSKLESTGAKQGQTTGIPTQRPAYAASNSPIQAATAEVIAQGIDFSAKPVQSGSNSSEGPEMPTPRNALTDQQIAALAEGGAVVAAEAPVVEATAPAAEAPAETVAPAAEGSGVAAPAAAAPAQTPEANSAPVVTFLQTELAKAQAQIVDLSVNLKAAESKAETATAAAAGFKAIAQASVDRMKVALSMPSGIAASSDEALLAEHAALRGKFEANFKPGGVAAVSAVAPQEGAGTQPDLARQARIQATRLK
jgi:signal peptide peptidase SppA